MITQSLSAQKWDLKGFWPWVPLLGKSMETAADLMGVTEWLPATVPGGVHYDLHRAGLIPHPYHDLNSLQCEWVEHRWWLYRTTLLRPTTPGRRIELFFHGLDYEVGVYVGDRHLGDHRGMYQPASFDLTEDFATHPEIELKLLVRSAPDEMGQIGRTSQTFTQKSRFGYKWDFSTRLVNLGIWDAVELRIHDDGSLGDVAVHTDYADGIGVIELTAATRAHVPADLRSTLDIALFDSAGREVAHQQLPFDADAVSTSLCVSDPELWYPNGYGPQPLYRLRLRLTAATRVCDERTINVGIRRLSYERNPGGPSDALPYTFVVNDRRLHIQGVNLTPLDHLYGNVTPEHYAWIVRSMRHAHVNLVRVWGGGVIEREVFYDLCDRHGILVWQEFIQSSSGVDNVPSQRPEFLALLHDSAVAALRARRNHPSLAVWSGGNELMSAPNVPSTLDDPNLAMLRELVQQEDPHRLFLPTSASGPVEYITSERGVMHDVHGHWKYQGPADHYALYGEADSLFHSEFGVDGCSDARSLEKFLSPAHRQPTSMRKSLVWRHHGEWWDTFDRDQGFFGEVTDLALFTDCSQWIQAEGLRFILEANRRHQPRNSGSIIWQLNEPWPNVSCTNLVDYFGEKKMAFYWARLAFTASHASLDYRQLSHPIGTTLQSTVHLHHRGPATSAQLHLEVLTATGRVLLAREQAVTLPSDGTSVIDELQFPVEPCHGEIFFVRLTLSDTPVEASANLYVFSTRTELPYASALALRPGDLTAQALGTWETSPDDVLERAYRVTNTGADVALFVRPEELTGAWWSECDAAFTSLFPGETHLFNVRCFPMRAGGLLQPAPPATAEQPQIHFRPWGGRPA